MPLTQPRIWRLAIQLHRVQILFHFGERCLRLLGCRETCNVDSQSSLWHSKIRSHDAKERCSIPSVTQRFSNECGIGLWVLALTQINIFQNVEIWTQLLQSSHTWFECGNARCILTHSRRTDLQTSKCKVQNQKNVLRFQDSKALRL